MHHAGLTHLFAHPIILNRRNVARKFFYAKTMNIETIQLTERRKQLLRAVIQEYVRTAQPVGSNNISHNTALAVSPATIRNDLAALEAQGLLTHPHTSAGRIPTDAGYRYFVHHLLADSELPVDERQGIRLEFSLVRQELDQWLTTSTAVLARTSQNAALATAPRSMRSRYKHMELVAIYGVKVLMVLVLDDGTVKQQLLDLDQPVEQVELSKISNELNDRLSGQNTNEIDSLMTFLTPFARQVALLVTDVMSRLDNQVSGQIFRDGLAHMLDAPEFAGGENVRRIVQVFEQRSLLDQIVGELSDDHDVQVVIAGDGRMPELRDISLVIGRYGVSDRASGVLGVIGPVRMAYGRSIGAVRFVAGLMSEIVEEMYGP
jgi:heat-inducible transcriptional repressor